MLEGGHMVEKNIKKQTKFQRVLYNLGKKGAYYTDHYNMSLLSQLFRFPKEDKVCIIEPSIGDGSAVSILTQKDSNENIEIFGVELDRQSFKTANENPNISYCINADFLNGVKISPSSFSMCFGNPPYGKSQIGERYERSFLRTVTGYLKKDGILVWIVSYKIFHEDKKYAHILTNRYNVLSVFKFHEPEYSRFHQIAIIAVKKADNSPDEKEEQRVIEQILDINNMPLIPKLVKEEDKIQVLPSNPDNIKLFESIKMSMSDVNEALSKSKLYNYFTDRAVINDDFMEIGRPPIVPKKDHLYLLSVSGYSEGRMGSEENKDVHLQRGKILIDKSKSYEVLESGKVVESVKTFSRSIVTVIENDGSITEIK